MTADNLMGPGNLTDRIAAEIADSFDEELEMELDDGGLEKLLDIYGEHPDRRRLWIRAYLFQGAIPAAG